MAARQRAHQARLADAVAPEQPGDATGPCSKRDVAQDRRRAIGERDAIDNERLAAGRQTVFPMPILALGAESGVKDGLVKALRAGPAPQAQGGEVKGCGHYMPEECPAELLGRMDRFFNATR